MVAWTAESALKERLAVKNQRPLLAPLLEKEPLSNFIRIYWNDERRKRDAFRDLGDMLHHAETLLIGESIARPLHSSTVHASHLQVLTLAIGDLLHPKKMYSPRAAAKEYNDLARRRLVAWFWAATFSEARLTGRDIVDEATQLADWARRPPSEAPPDGSPRSNRQQSDGWTESPIATATGAIGLSSRSSREEILAIR